jgi:hypothetical protein
METLLIKQSIGDHTEGEKVCSSESRRYNIEDYKIRASSIVINMHSFKLWSQNGPSFPRKCL